MNSEPPKKKLRQLSILKMLSNPKPGKVLNSEGIKSNDSVLENNSTLNKCDKSEHTINLVKTEKIHSEEKIVEQSMSKLHFSCSSSSESSKNLRMQRCEQMAIAAEKRLKLKIKNSSPEFSPDMFDSSSDSPEDMSWRGCPLSAFRFLNEDNLNIPPVISAPNHKVCIKLPISGVPEPFPPIYVDIWDSDHVRMPNSPSSFYAVKEPGEKVKLIPRWTLICKAFEKPIRNTDELSNAILSYNQRYENKWKFLGLKKLLEEEFSEEEHNYFFEAILPGIIQLALSLPSIVTSPPPLLTKNMNASITMSQRQVSSLLANAFLCTFPRRNAKGADKEYSSFPDINFNRLFFHAKQCALEKLKCIIHYFKEMITNGRNGVLTFTRQFAPYLETSQMEASTKPLPKLHVDSEGFIESTHGLLQVDFANKYLGGGVLGLGCVQEEIRFVLCPELIITRLFVECLHKRDALIVTGVEQFSKGEGYGSNFQWAGQLKDATPSDSFFRKLCQVVAIDALFFSHRPFLQYKPEFVMREAVKAFIGFRPIEGSGGMSTGTATGNWGCGAFRGNPYLKSLIQLAAAGEAGRDVCYFTFGDTDLRNKMAEMHEFLIEREVTVGELLTVLCQYGSRDSVDGNDLYHYIKYNISANCSDTDSPDSDLLSTVVQDDGLNSELNSVSDIASSSHSDAKGMENEISNQSKNDSPNTSKKSKEESSKLFAYLDEIDREL